MKRLILLITVYCSLITLLRAGQRINNLTTTGTTTITGTVANSANVTNSGSNDFTGTMTIGSGVAVVNGSSFQTFSDNGVTQTFNIDGATGIVTIGAGGLMLYPDGSANFSFGGAGFDNAGRINGISFTGAIDDATVYGNSMDSLFDWSGSALTANNASNTVNDLPTFFGGAYSFSGGSSVILMTDGDGSGLTFSGVDFGTSVSFVVNAFTSNLYDGSGGYVSVAQNAYFPGNDFVTFWSSYGYTVNGTIGLFLSSDGDGSGLGLDFGNGAQPIITSINLVTTSAATSGTVNATGDSLNETIYLSSGSTIANITISLTNMPENGIVRIHSKSAITSLTVSTGASASFDDAAVTSMTAGQTIAYQLTDNGAKIIRIQ